jgi:hypothetical protein
MQCQKQSLEETRENIQSVISIDAINLIRFPLMTKEDFAIVNSSRENRLLNGLYIYFEEDQKTPFNYFVLILR